MNRLTCAQLRKQAMGVSLEPAVAHTLAKPNTRLMISMECSTPTRT